MSNIVETLKSLAKEQEQTRRMKSQVRKFIKKHPINREKATAEYSALVSNGIPSARGYGAPRRRYDERCKWCQGTGFVRGISKPHEPCQGCTESE